MSIKNKLFLLIKRKELEPEPHMNNVYCIKGRLIVHNEVRSKGYKGMSNKASHVFMEGGKELDWKELVTLYQDLR